MKQGLKKYILWVVDLIINVAVVLGVVLLIMKFIIAPFDIFGPSMCNDLNFIDDECTQEYGEKIIINKAGYRVSEPERGDIIIFTPKFSDEKFFIKRIIGLPGETIEILNKQVYVTNEDNPTGTKLEEPYLGDENLNNTESFSKGYKIFQVPEGEYFVLGDNRKASTDSRSCFKSPYGDGCNNNIEEAFVPKENIEGKAWIVWWPIPSWRIMDQPEYSELISESDQK